jgi:glycosyltransferase involved in cell wall biosynthesis
MLKDSKIKVAVWLNEDMIPQEGGAYSYLQLLLSLLDQNNFENTDLVFITHKPTKKNSFQRSIVFLNNYYGFYMNSLKLLRRIFGGNKSFNSYLSLKIDIENDRVIKSIGIDYVYYLNQCQRELKQTAFIATNWDLAHLTLKGFDEFIENGQLEKRNDWYFNQLPLASSVVVESAAGKQEIIKHLKIAQDKIQVVPFFINPSEFKPSEGYVKEFLSRYKISSKQYLYYPAQYWEHKNHINLLSAFALVIKTNQNLKLVLSGSDKGYLAVINRHIAKLNISDNVILLGFVSENEKHILYSNAMCLAMPSHLGPTNLPPLEALNYQVPVICSNLTGHMEMMGDSAIYFDPNKVDEIANAIETICNLEIQNNYILKGKNIKEKTKFTFKSALNAHADMFNKLYSDKINGNLKNS